MLITAIDITSRPVVSTHQQDVGHACDSATQPSSRISDGWIVVHSYPQAEAWAALNLERRGYHAYLPMMTVRRRDRVLRSMWHHVETPLFPRYLFVRFPGHWVPIRYTPGVYRIVSAAGFPNMASEAEISAVQATEAVRRSPPAQSARWAPGMPFEGMPAVITSVLDEQVQISMMMLGCFRSITVHADCLVARDE
jgi:transcription antitermination factor NusG